ncbi:hypothetical protein RchiOBHm_Chr1g0319481 [Rosa chinensis]|uniref:Uncharacterized protein n=1 Tax=Rosa chinensis TaxID=74649 RepID=A0A2P6S8G6_ROSCH|nr:hypothetical protein RchiOBHm_Chr1g0319481 [Rosa chinensis]
MMIQVRESKGGSFWVFTASFLSFPGGSGHKPLCCRHHSHKPLQLRRLEALLFEPSGSKPSLLFQCGREPSPSHRWIQCTEETDDQEVRFCLGLFGFLEIVQK